MEFSQNGRSLSFISAYRLTLSLVVTCCTIRCLSLSFVVLLVVTRCITLLSFDRQSWNSVTVAWKTFDLGMEEHIIKTFFFAHTLSRFLPIPFLYKIYIYIYIFILCWNIYSLKEAEKLLRDKSVYQKVNFDEKLLCELVDKNNSSFKELKRMECITNRT